MHDGGQDFVPDEVESFWRRLFSGEAPVYVPRRLLQSAQEFLHLEASSGIFLLLATIVALIWANSPWDQAYFDLINTHLVLDLSIVRIDESLQHWVNDALMTLFFFLMGLEIKREAVHGELSSPRRAALPAAAALGGIVVPALLYLALNAGGEGVDGWAIPMATDIAFAVGVLALLGSRVPFSAKVFLLALAIVDDIGAILVIAVFYTESLDLQALFFAGVLLVLIVLANRGGIRNTGLYAIAGAGLWLAMFESGIHATLAGVVLGLLAPASPYYDTRRFQETLHQLGESFQSALNLGDSSLQQQVLGQIEDLNRGTESPLERLERALHAWVGFVIVPVFALVNAGLPITREAAETAISSPVSQGVVLGLLVGKPVGVFLFTWLAVRLGIGEMLRGSSWMQIAGIGLLAGIGFTVSLLITDLGFGDRPLASEAKIAVLSASAMAGLLGYTLLRMSAPASGTQGSQSHTRPPG